MKGTLYTTTYVCQTLWNFLHIVDYLICLIWAIFKNKLICQTEFVKTSIVYYGYIYVKIIWRKISICTQQTDDFMSHVRMKFQLSQLVDQGVDFAPNQFSLVVHAKIIQFSNSYRIIHLPCLHWG